VAASRKKSFLISEMPPNAEVELCSLYQFADVFSGITSRKISAHLSFCNNLQYIAYGLCSICTNSKTFWYCQTV